MMALWQAAAWVLTMALAVALVVGAYGGCLDPRRHSAVWSLATLAFPLVLAAVLVALAAWTLLRRWGRVAVMVVAVVVSWPMVRVTAPVNLASRSDADSTRRFKLLTFNVMNHGTYDGTQKERNPSMDYILSQDADLVLLQEAAVVDSNFLDLPSIRMMKPELLRRYPYRSRGYHDQVLLSKYPFKVVDNTAIGRGVIEPDEQSTLYCFYAKVYDVQMPHGQQLRLVNVHLQSIGLTSDDKKLYMRLTRLDEGMGSRSEMRAVKHSLIDKLSFAFRRRAATAWNLRRVLDASPDNVVLAGDFNDTPGSYAYRTIRGGDMADAWADCALGPTYTFHANRLYFHIDQVLYRGSLKAVSAKRDRAGDSDHYPVVAEFEWTAPPGR